MTKFKTTLLAMAVSAAAFSVQAAQVSLYGSVSTGVLYQNQASLSGGPDAANQESKDSFTMESGFWGDSIWGITGEEDLGNGWTVGFTLENEFGSDTGEMASEGTILTVRPTCASAMTKSILPSATSAVWQVPAATLT